MLKRPSSRRKSSAEGVNLNLVPVLDTMVTMREELRQLWLNTSQSREQLAADLQAWCRRAEESGIAQLQQFSLRLRSASA